VIFVRLRTNNMLERIMREIRRRTRVVGNFPDGQSALMRVAARLRHVAGTRWGSRQYMDMERLREQEQESQHERVA
jgi:transposase-like protein